MKPAPFKARPQHTQEAWAGAYLRHLIDRTGKTAEQIADHYYCDAGSNPEQDWPRFLRWCRAALMALERGGEPFTRQMGAYA